MRADNRGEGGILALTALVSRGLERNRGRRVVARRLRHLRRRDVLRRRHDHAGDLGAGRGRGARDRRAGAASLHRAGDGRRSCVALFAIQKHGTASVGALFGPVMCVWFVVLAVLGALQIVAASRGARRAQPRAMRSRSSRTIPLLAFLALGAVVLAVTGTEALYADMGHFGASPIRRAWLLLRDAGAGAQLLRAGRAAARTTRRRSRIRSTCSRRSGR